VYLIIAEEVHKGRGGKEGRENPRFECVHRNRPIEESLHEFQAMRDGKYKPKEAFLRMKQDIINNPNPNMWDLTAYRVLEHPHHRTGDKWRVYPTYDFTHCLCDSFENITHSLCTTEFALARESYEWLCDALSVFKPAQREYGRLNLSGTIMSKRKILKLVQGGYVHGWDDPRLYTIVALRRRGIPPGGILSFVGQLGITPSYTTIDIAKFETIIRGYLENIVPRLMMILDPIPVIIENLPDDYYQDVILPYKKDDPSYGEHSVPFTKHIFIEREDFRIEPSKNYNRLTPNGIVGLFNTDFPIQTISYSADSNGRVTEIRAKALNEGPKVKAKAYIHWVAISAEHNSPVYLKQVRLFTPLFKSVNPDSNPEGFLTDLNPHSEECYDNAVIETGFHEIRKNSPWRENEGGVTEEKGRPETVRFQAMRTGYFCLDSDSSNKEFMLNRIVGLKQDAGF
jgi:glutaminyl-tRNA synthetase